MNETMTDFAEKFFYRHKYKW